MFTRILCIFLLSAAMASCAGPAKGSRVHPSAAKPGFVMDVFLARGFLGGSEYERYHLEQGVLWRECGSISADLAGEANPPLEGDDLLGRDPTLTIDERRVDAVEEEDLRFLEDRGRHFLGVWRGAEEDPPQPGSVFGLASPGVLELSLSFGKETERIATSVDAAANRESAALADLHDLVESIRSVGPLICGEKSFFGIGRRREVRR